MADIYRTALEEMLAQAERYAAALQRNKQNYDFLKNTAGWKGTKCDEELAEIEKEMTALNCDSMHINNVNRDSNTLRPFEQGSLYVCTENVDTSALLKARTDGQNKLQAAATELRSILTPQKQ